MGITSLQDLRDLLDVLDGQPGNVTFSQSGGVTRFDVTVVKTLGGVADVDIPVFGQPIDMTGTIGISADVTLHLLFGVDANGFFVDANANATPELTVSNLRTTGSPDGDGTFGFMGVNLTNAVLAVDPQWQLTVSLRDPGVNPLTGVDDGLIRFGDLGW